MAFELSVDDILPDIINDIGEEYFITEPEAKKQRTSETTHKHWMTVGNETQTSVKLTSLDAKLFFEIPKDQVPLINPFIEYLIEFDAIPPTESIHVSDIRVCSKIPKEKWNKFSYDEKVRRRKRDWTPKETLKLSDYSHSPLFSVLTRERSYFEILLAYGKEFVNTLPDSYCSDMLLHKHTDKFYFPFCFKFIPDGIKFTRPLSLPDSLVKIWDAIESIIKNYKDTGSFQCEPYSFLQRYDFVDKENKLVMARKAEKIIRDNFHLIREVHITKAVVVHDDKDNDFVIVNDAEHVSDAQWSRLFKLKKPLICYGNPAFTVVDPFLHHHFNGFRFICFLFDKPIVHEAEDWHKFVYKAFETRRFQSIIQAKTDFFRYIPETVDWKTIQKQIGISSNTLILCGNDSIYKDAMMFMSSNSRVQTFDYQTLKIGEELAPKSRLLNFTTFTSCFSEPRDHLVMIIGPDTPRTLMAATTKLGKKKITVYWAPGTPVNKRVL